MTDEKTTDNDTAIVEEETAVDNDQEASITADDNVESDSEKTKSETDESEAKVNPDLALTRKVNGVSALLRNYYAKSNKGDAWSDPLRGQGRVLALMAMKPETTQKELKFLLGMKQQSLSELLAKLEAKGFVEREKSTDDGRVTIVRLTEAGAAAAPDPEGADQAYGAYDCFNADERDQFEKLVDQLEVSLKEKLGDDAHECGHGDEEEGEQKRHRYGQQNRGSIFGSSSFNGGHGKGGGKGAGGGAGQGKGTKSGSGHGTSKSTGASARGKSAAGRGKGAGAGKGAGSGKGGRSGQAGRKGGTGGKGGRSASSSASNFLDIATGLADLGASSLSGLSGLSGRGGRGGRGGR